MALYSERHGLRNERTKSNNVSLEAYSLLFECCQKYLIYLAWKFPENCPDRKGICNYDKEKLDIDLKFEIPDLFRRDGVVDRPRKATNIFAGTQQDSFNQYALFDYIEYIAKNIKDYRLGDYHGFFSHYHYIFLSTNNISQTFCDEINDLFEKTDLLYKINEHLEIERVNVFGPLSQDVEEKIKNVQEDGLRELLQEAVSLYKSPNPNSMQNATEKIWDAFERLKTYYTSLDKKNSANKVIKNLASSNNDFELMITDEFRTLTNIGNNYRIRHHETDRIEINDPNHYEYLFNRCLSVITLALHYL